MRNDVRATGFGRRSAGAAETQATPVTVQKEHGAAHATAATDLRKKQSVTATVPASKTKNNFASVNVRGSIPPVSETEDGLLDAALEIAQRHEEIISRLRVAVRRRNVKEIVRVAKELVADG